MTALRGPAAATTTASRPRARPGRRSGRRTRRRPSRVPGHRQRPPSGTTDRPWSAGARRRAGESRRQPDEDSVTSPSAATSRKAPIAASGAQDADRRFGTARRPHGRDRGAVDGVAVRRRDQGCAGLAQRLLPPGGPLLALDETGEPEQDEDEHERPRPRTGPAPYTSPSAASRMAWTISASRVAAGERHEAARGRSGRSTIWRASVEPAMVAWSAAAPQSR